MRHFLNSIASIIARSIGSLSPAEEWYWTTFRVSRMFAPFFRIVIRFTPFRNDPRREIIGSWLVSTLLRRVDSLEKPFPIPIRVTGTEELFEARNHPQGVVIISVHLPLWNLVLRSLAELNCSPSGVVAGQKVIRGGVVRAWGTAARFPGLLVTKSVYIKVRGMLRYGGSIATMMDTGPGGPLNVNLLRFIGAISARVVFATVELDNNGQVQVRFYRPPDPFCTTKQSIRANIEFFEARIDDVLHGSGVALEGERDQPCEYFE